jgi:hypothetical protein
MSKVFWPYNKSFNVYHDVPLAGKRATKFIEEKNKEKGGNWELHTPEQYEEWYDKIGSHKDYLKYGP